ncbi:MAG: diguanylate cyclase [Gammaproteobacteria bacterium]|nr:diguanylate cyclase [Gammaproteobacteria bacterium]
MNDASQNSTVYTQDDDVRLLPKIIMLLQRVNPSDIFSTRDHSVDFISSRADYISIRARVLSIVFAFLAIAWIPIDYYTMDEVVFSEFLVLRLIFSSLFVVLALWGSHCYNLYVARARIVGFIVIPGLFYLASHMLLPENSEESIILIGYSFMPLLVMALLAIFPLTFLEGVSFITLSTLLFVTTKLIDQSMFTADALGDLWLLFLLGGIALWVELTQLYMLMNLYREATRDALTGLVNRRILSKKLEDEIKESERSGNDLYIMLFDLDFFKRINDTYGHKMGDFVLCHFAKILKSHCNDTIVAGRYGGEEFLAIATGHRREEALELADSIRRSCHEAEIYNPHKDERIKFTTSVGVTRREANEDAGQLFSRADEELYRAKSSGRDFVAISD